MMRSRLYIAGSGWSAPPAFGKPVLKAAVTTSINVAASIVFFIV